MQLSLGLISRNSLWNWALNLTLKLISRKILEIILPYYTCLEFDFTKEIVKTSYVFQSWIHEWFLKLLWIWFHGKKREIDLQYYFQSWFHEKNREVELRILFQSWFHGKFLRLSFSICVTLMREYYTSKVLPLN